MINGNIKECFRIFRIVPVAVIRDKNTAAETALMLYTSGYRCVEITMRTPDAAEAIFIAAQSGAEITVGAGTVINRAQAAEAISAGAEFIVSPGLDEGVASVCREKNIPYIPGVCTPTEITRAVNMGFDFLKFFPAEASGGINMLKAISAPFPGVGFMPTGGINPGNIDGYLALPQVVCVGGSYMIPTVK